MGLKLTPHFVEHPLLTTTLSLQIIDITMLWKILKYDLSNLVIWNNSIGFYFTFVSKRMKQKCFEIKQFDYDIIETIFHILSYFTM